MAGRGPRSAPPHRLLLLPLLLLQLLGSCRAGLYFKEGQRCYKPLLRQTAERR